jgi:hypothetical protein
MTSSMCPLRARARASSNRRSASRATPSRDIERWARGHALAAERIQREAYREERTLEETIDRIDELRGLADVLGAPLERDQAESENLAFHLTWARVRRACRLG